MVDLRAAVDVPRRIADANAIPLRVCTLPAALGVEHNTLNLAALGADGDEWRRRYVALYEGEPVPLNTAGA